MCRVDQTAGPLELRGGVGVRRNPFAAVDGGDGPASVELSAPDHSALEAMKLRTESPLGAESHSSNEPRTYGPWKHCGYANRQSG